jgi:hypothetical protein
MFRCWKQAETELGAWTLSVVRSSKIRKHNVSETGSISVRSRMEGDTYSVGSLRKR